MTSTSKGLNPKPQLPTPQSVTDVLNNAKKLRANALKSSDPQAIRAEIKKVDDILKDIASLQTQVGALRKEMVNHEGSFRKTSPKRRPADGTTQMINGVQHAYYQGAWSPVSTGEPGAR